MKNLKMVVLIVVSLLVLIIVLQNTQSVETKLLFVTITMPRAFLLFLTFLFGFIIGIITTASISGKSQKRDKIKSID